MEQSMLPCEVILTLIEQEIGIFIKAAKPNRSSSIDRRNERVE